MTSQAFKNFARWHLSFVIPCAYVPLQAVLKDNGDPVFKRSSGLSMASIAFTAPRVTKPKRHAT